MPRRHRVRIQEILREGPVLTLGVQAIMALFLGVGYFLDSKLFLLLGATCGMFSIFCLAVDALTTGVAWTQTGTRIRREEAPVFYWMFVLGFGLIGLLVVCGFLVLWATA